MALRETFEKIFFNMGVLGDKKKLNKIFLFFFPLQIIPSPQFPYITLATENREEKQFHSSFLHFLVNRLVITVTP